MQQTISKRLRIALLVAALMPGVYVATYLLTAEAVTPRTVGSLTIGFSPNGGTVHAEYVDIEYAGFGVADLAGWIISNQNGIVDDLDGVVVSNGQVVRVCESTSTSNQCDAFWQGSDSFSDAGGEFILTDSFGTDIVKISYEAVSSGTELAGDGPYQANVLSKNDKVRVCSATNKSDFQEKMVNTVTIANSFENPNGGGSLRPDDIVRSFFYDVGKGLKYYPGSRWPADSSIYDNNCQ